MGGLVPPKRHHRIDSRHQLRVCWSAGDLDFPRWYLRRAASRGILATMQTEVTLSTTPVLGLASASRWLSVGGNQLTLLLVVVALQGCGGDSTMKSTPPPPPPVLPDPVVRVSPSATTIAVGGTNQLSAEAINLPGNQGFVWRTLDQRVALVNASGLVTATGRGSTQVTVRPTIDTAVVGYANVTVQ